MQITRQYTINPYFNNVVSFKNNSSNINNPLEIKDEYVSSDSKKKTVTILGISNNAESLKEPIKKTFRIARELVNRGYNILTGCGAKGIMGAAYKGALSAEKDPENPKKNLAVLVNPPWEEGDQEHCVVISKPASSEADRIENGFSKASNNFLIFPGGPCSIQEASALIAKNKHLKGSEHLNIFLVGSDYYRGLIQQYDDMEKLGTLGIERENLFKVIEPDEILDKFPELKE